MSEKIQRLYNQLKALNDEYTVAKIEELSFIAEKMEPELEPKYDDFYSGETVECLQELLTWFGRDKLNYF